MYKSYIIIYTAKEEICLQRFNCSFYPVTVNRETLLKSGDIFIRK